MNNSRILVLASRIESIDRIHTFLYELGKEWGLTDKAIGQLTLVIEELVTNTIRYGYKDDAVHEIDVSFTYEHGTMGITIHDDGNQFDPLSIPSPDITASIEDRPIGGLGLYLVRKTMDSVRYERRNNENYTMLTKKIQ